MTMVFTCTMLVFVVVFLFPRFFALGSERLSDNLLSCVTKDRDLLITVAEKWADPDWFTQYLF